MPNYLKSVTDLHLAAAKNDLPQIKKLLSSGIEVDVKDGYNKTPLHRAAAKNIDESHSEAIEILLKSGANVNVQDNYKRTPLYNLVNNCNLKVVRLFFNYDVDISVKDIFGQTVLFPAVSDNQNIEVVQFLISQGLNVNHCCGDVYDNTPMYLACDSKNFKMIKCLLKNGADINLVNRVGDSPLKKIMDMYKYYNIHNEEKMMEKNLNFMIEHSDFNLIHENINDFSCNFYLDKSLDHFMKLILKHISMLKVLNIQMKQSLLSSISKLKEFDQFFNQCQEELSRAKSTKFKNSWITFYNLLVDNRKKLKNYAGNDELIRDFKSSDCEIKFPIYGASMKENVENGIRRRKLFDESTFLLSNCLPIFNPTHLIIKDVLDCIMSKKDLSKFCKETYNF